jgi:hypothetical protein
MVRAVEGAVTEGGFGTAGPGGTPASANALRPLGVGETLDRAIKLYRNNAVALWTIVAVVIVPLEIIEVIVRRLSLPSDVFVLNGKLYTFTTSGSNGAGGTVALLLVALLGLLGQLVSTGAAFKLVLDSYIGRTPTWQESFAFARHRLGSLLWLGILETVLIAIGFVLLFIPGIWLLVACSVAVPALMLEGVGGFKAMKRSIDLVDTRWWATFGRLLVMFLLYGVLTFVIQELIRLFTDGVNVTNVTLWVVIDGILRAFVIILMTPFIVSVLTTMYIDLRVRKEALDIELLASRFGPPGSTVPPQTGLEREHDPHGGLPPPEPPTWPPTG